MMPIAKTKPGTAYPKEREKLVEESKMLLSNRFKKLSPSEKNVQKMAARKPK